MAFDMEEEMRAVYEKWLMENYPDEIKGKHDFTKKVEKCFRYSEFIQEIKELLDIKE